jgi:phage recombination protein Bet
MASPLLPDLAGADTCPDCRVDHRDIPPGGGCPIHGHQLTKLIDTNAWTCPVQGCAYTQTGAPPAMTTTSPAIPEPHAPATELAIRDGQPFWSDKQLAALRQLGIDGASNADLAVFMHFCQRTGLDPFARQVTMIKRGSKWTIQTEIDGYRVIARRAATRNRQVISYGPTIWVDENGKEYRRWVSSRPPAGAEVTIYIDGAPFPGYARYEAFVARDSSGNPVNLWKSMPDHMIAKCAEAQALRKAFPQDLADTITGDEAPREYADAADMAWNQPGPAIQPKRRRVLARRTSTEDGLPEAADRLAIEWDRLGVQDVDEQLNLTAALAGTDTVLDSVRDLPADELGRIAGLLADCTDLGEVHQLIDAGDKPAT